MKLEELKESLKELYNNIKFSEQDNKLYIYTGTELHVCIYLDGNKDYIFMYNSTFLTEKEKQTHREKLLQAMNLITLFIETNRKEE